MSNFYYTIMFFSLKNTSVTYQRVMIAIFLYMLHGYLKDYIDDIIVKFNEVFDHAMI